MLLNERKSREEKLEQKKKNKNVPSANTTIIEERCPAGENLGLEMI